ncbi:MAG: DUF308 domain-containing protein [Muribaculum sp.]|nr:DUF308 domain-containing protein [Muribaculum sp.]
MKSKNLTYSGIITLILGILLIFMKGAAISAVVMVMGVFFLVAAVLNVYFAFKKYSSPYVAILTAIGSMALGLWLLFDPEGFTSILVYVFAGLMILAGLYHICMLAFGFKDAKFPFAFYILPILLVIGGAVIIIIGSERMINMIVLLTGIALIVYAVCNFLEAAGESSYKKIPQ